jgi:hypothetical protein
MAGIGRLDGWTDLLYACPRHLGEEEVRDSDSAESEAARMYSRCAATAARAGQAPDPEPKCRGGVQGSAGHEVDGLREPGQPRCGSHDCPRVAGRGAGQSAGAAVGDQREAVRSGGRARHPCRHHSGERDLIQAEGGGRCGAYRDGKTGKPQRGLSRPRRPTGTGHRRPAIRGRHRDGPRAACSAPRACSSDGLRRCRERRREGSTRLGTAVTRSR